jgi:uncharacterized protein (TIGR03437 family)
MQLTEELFMNSRQSGSVRKLVRLGGIGILSAVAFAQTTPVVLDIAIESSVQYVADVTDPSKLALSASATTAASTRAFTDTIFVGDIVSINGKPAKGMWTSRQYKMGFSPSPAAGLAISDATQGTIAECKWEIQNANGQSAEVLGAVGYAGAVDGYQVNLRFPAGIAAGTASLNLTAAWVPGSAVTIATK